MNPKLVALFNLSMAQSKFLTSMKLAFVIPAQKK